MYYIYILTNKVNTAFYIGVTSNLIKRIWEHKNGVVEGFTKRYKLHKLVYYEVTGDIEQAILREKQLKNWHRKWKETLIQEKNSDYIDLYNSII